MSMQKLTIYRPHWTELILFMALPIRKGGLSDRGGCNCLAEQTRAGPSLPALQKKHGTPAAPGQAFLKFEIKIFQVFSE